MALSLFLLKCKYKIRVNDIFTILVLNINIADLIIIWDFRIYNDKMTVVS